MYSIHIVTIDHCWTLPRVVGSGERSDLQIFDMSHLIWVYLFRYDDVGKVIFAFMLLGQRSAQVDNTYKMSRAWQVGDAR